MKVIESDSAWDFFDLLRDQAKKILNLGDKKKYTDPTGVIEGELIHFLNSLPNGDYDKLIKDWIKYNSNEERSEIRTSKN